MRTLKLLRQVERLESPTEKYVEWVPSDTDVQRLVMHGHTLPLRHVDFYEEVTAAPEIWAALENLMPGVYAPPPNDPGPIIRRIGAALADRKAQETTEAGFFAYAGKTFATTERSQRLLTGTWGVRDLPGVFPLTWPTSDDADFLVINNAAEFTAFYLAAFAQIRTFQEVGVWAKQQIALCSTVDEILAVLDTAWP